MYSGRNSKKKVVTVYGLFGAELVQAWVFRSMTIQVRTNKTIRKCYLHFFPVFKDKAVGAISLFQN